MTPQEPVEDNDEPIVVIAYDGSEGARRAVDRAAALFPGARALVVTAWTGVTETAPELLLAPGGVVAAAIGTIGDVLESRAQESAGEGARLAVAAGLAAEPRVVHARSASWEGILRVADDAGATAIVLGSRGRSALVAAALGSVSTGVLNHSTRPVLVVPRG